MRPYMVRFWRLLPVEGLFFNSPTFFTLLHATLHPLSLFLFYFYANRVNVICEAVLLARPAPPPVRLFK